MAEPFEVCDQEPGGVLGRVRTGGRKRAFVRDLETLLAKAERVTDVGLPQIEGLARRHSIDLGREVPTPRRNLYRRFLEFCLDDQAMSPEESAELEHLQKVLGLTENEIISVHQDVAHRVYGEAIDDVLADHRLDPEEEEFLKGLQKDLRLSADAAERLQEEGAQRSRQRYMRDSISHDSYLLARKEAQLELSGSSDGSLEEAIRGALGEACSAVPDLGWAELSEVRVEVEEGRMRAWRVKLKAGLTK